MVSLNRLCLESRSAVDANKADDTETSSALTGYTVVLKPNLLTISR